MSKHQILPGTEDGRGDASRDQNRRGEPGGFWETLISDHDLFPSYEGPQDPAKGQESWGFFRDAQVFGRLDSGSRAGFTITSPPPWTSVFQFFLVLYDAWP